VLNFPDNPTIDQVFDTPKSPFIWLGDRWKRGGVVPPPIVQPVLTSLSPDRAAHGTFYGGTISYRGSGFDPTCITYYDGSPAPSYTYISPTEVQAHGIDGPPMSADTVIKDCFVRNSVGDSATLPFRYYNSSLGVPYVTFVDPNDVSFINTALLEIEVTGTDFSNDAVVTIRDVDTNETYQMVTRYVAQNMVRFDCRPADYSNGQQRQWALRVEQANGVSNDYPWFFV
jgi:hypothetical protein